MSHTVADPGRSQASGANEQSWLALFAQIIWPLVGPNDSRRARSMLAAPGWHLLLTATDLEEVDVMSLAASVRVSIRSSAAWRECACGRLVAQPPDDGCCNDCRKPARSRRARLR
ncbi:hypothetical protein [Catellatospora sp. NPDC049133]|uniref:hypothetical protein n=1 Tax=Catellatospora sp. NPDC049133 TaxID=3155499 RepID=UPI0033E39E1A